MDEITITANQWNQLAYLNVIGFPLIYLLGLSASNWPHNCKISCYDISELIEVVNKVISTASLKSGGFCFISGFKIL